MTEYEVADYTASMMGNFLTAFTIFLTVITAYVIAAFIAGERMTGVQLLIINACFLVASSIVGFLVVTIFQRFYTFARMVENPAGTIEPVNLSVPLGILVIGIVVGCYVFMWATRRGTQSEGISNDT